MTPQTMTPPMKTNTVEINTPTQRFPADLPGRTEYHRAGEKDPGGRKNQPKNNEEDLAALGWPWSQRNYRIIADLI
jgi:hypothetical protein